MKKTSLIGFLIIGNEILSGRTAEKNLPALAKILQTRGLHINESLIVRDLQKDIVAALNHLLSSCDYVFTSGGIGATHDDITTAAVAAYLKLAVEENPEMLALLSRFCKNRGLPITAVRRRMALAPKGANAVLSDFPERPVTQLITFWCAPACQAYLPSWPPPPQKAYRRESRFFLKR